MDPEDIKEDLIDHILYGTYDMDGAITLRDDDEDDEDEDDDNECDTPVKSTMSIYYIGNGTIRLEMDRISETKYAACGCPVCDGKLKVIGKAERMGRMPTLYASVCQACGANICFGSDETIFFPLKEEGDGKE